MVRYTYEPRVAAILAAVTFSPRPSLDRAPFDSVYSLKGRSDVVIISINHIQKPTYWSLKYSYDPKRSPE